MLVHGATPPSAFRMNELPNITKDWHNTYRARNLLVPLHLTFSAVQGTFMLSLPRYAWCEKNEACTTESSSTSHDGGSKVFAFVAVIHYGIHHHYYNTHIHPDLNNANNLSIALHSNKLYVSHLFCEQSWSITNFPFNRPTSIPVHLFYFSYSLTEMLGYAQRNTMVARSLVVRALLLLQE